MTGFDAQVGLLCAKTLDLPIEQGRLMRAGLVRLREKLETLDTTLTEPADTAVMTVPSAL
jgi:hypothetical protein